eukprot:EG_transcript_14861
MAMASCGQCKTCTCSGGAAGGQHPHDHHHHDAKADKRYMAMALEEGEKGRPTAPPNPWVGCVIVKDDKVLGKGFHAKAGEPHAEPTAIADALAQGATAEDLQGSTFYVTLEPCCHYGRTPPCTDAIIKYKAARVVVAVQDPDERVAGNGIRKLQEAGIDVDVGVLEMEATLSLGPYLQARRTGTPFTGMYPALSLDIVSAGDS